MTEQDREGRPMIRSALVLKQQGIVGYKVDLKRRPGKPCFFPIEQITAVIYDPRRRMLIFSWPNPEGKIQFSSFKQADVVSACTLFKEIEPAVLEAERLLKKAQS